MSKDSAPVLTEIRQHNYPKFVWTKSPKVKPSLDQIPLHVGLKTEKFRVLYSLILAYFRVVPAPVPAPHCFPSPGPFAPWFWQPNGLKTEKLQS